MLLISIMFDFCFLLLLVVLSLYTSLVSRMPSLMEIFKKRCKWINCQDMLEPLVKTLYVNCQSFCMVWSVHLVSNLIDLVSLCLGTVSNVLPLIILFLYTTIFHQHLSWFFMWTILSFLKVTRSVLLNWNNIWVNSCIQKTWVLFTISLALKVACSF